MGSSGSTSGGGARVGVPVAGDLPGSHGSSGEAAAAPAGSMSVGQWAQQQQQQAQGPQVIVLDFGHAKVQAKEEEMQQETQLLAQLLGVSG